MSAPTTQARLFRLPDLGEGLTEAEILEWTVCVGDTVTTDQIVVVVETAKAAVEVPVPYPGRVVELHGRPGDVVDVGAPLIAVGAQIEDAARGDDVAQTAGHAAAERYRDEERAGSGSVLIGYGTGHAPAVRRRARVKATSQASTAPADRAADRTRVISPVVRKFARENGIDVTALTPGPTGVIRRRDVAAAIERRQQHPATHDDPAATGAERAGIVDSGGPAESADIAERIALRGMRRAVADKLSRARAEIPDATTWVDVDATELLAARETLRAAFPDRPVGLLALLARICAAGLARFPELNASVDTQRGEILRHGRLNLGFAAQTDRGLVVPVIRDAHTLSAARLHAEATRLTALAREGRIPPGDLTGGTFTLNNYGVFGVDGSTPIINHPEAAILGVGRIVDKPWVVDGALAVRKVTQLSLSFDHRVCDGGVAGGFLRYVADCVEHPVTLLADV